MSTVIAHTSSMTMRHLRSLWRQPMYVAITLVQPVLYLLLFGALFRRIVDIPGFSSPSYADFLTPGIVVMSALFSAAWVGMGVIEDMKAGVLDRFLAAPTFRGALNAGLLAQQAIVTVIQSAIIVGLGFAVGARFDGGVAGITVLLVTAILLGTATGSLSIALALSVRQEESLIGASQLLLLPLTFVAGIFMQESLMPSWMQTLARYNPVNWTIVAARESLQAEVDWQLVATNGGLLLLLTILCGLLATRAFRTYQRSL
jgi:ABC-2 type transport system permease protein